MMSNDFFSRTAEQQIESLTPFAVSVLASYGLIDIEVECINYEFNATFSVVTNSGVKYALRININSTRSRENILAEIEWVQFLQRVPEVNVPTPIANLDNDFLISSLHKDSGLVLNCVLYSWLDGVEVGDEPSMEQLHIIGRAIAHMHKASSKFTISSKSQLPIFKDLLWGTEDYLFGPKSILNERDRGLLLQAAQLIIGFTDELYEISSSHIIHADVHGWNLISNEGLIYIFDFDDCGFGLPAQDIAVALYYLDTPEQDAALLAGYTSVMALPEYSELAMKGLLLQRRLMLLNYLFETTNQEHKEMLPEYLEKTLARVSEFLVDAK
jgi:Ser/Thr protein kinase RdoA (MazF antagonist)